jgi:hypothetical protein
MESKDVLYIFNRVISVVSEKWFDFNLKFLKKIIDSTKLSEKERRTLIKDSVCKLKIALIIVKDFLKLAHRHMVSFDKLTADVQFSVFKKRLIIPKGYNKETIIQRSQVKAFLKHSNLAKEYLTLKKWIKLHKPFHNYQM